jgi:hypoxanthine-DNA glycosylase
MQEEFHPFEPFVPARPAVLVLGSFPGRESTQQQREGDWFYGAVRNQFWQILSLAYGEKLTTRAEKEDLFRRAGIAMTDVIKSCVRRDNRNTDDNLIEKRYNLEAIDAILREGRIRRVLFTSKNVQREFEQNIEPYLSAAARGYLHEKDVLPSPSPLYQTLTVEQKAAIYQQKLPPVGENN